MTEFMTDIKQAAQSISSPIYRDDILTLLALTALADKRILSEEISAFAKAAKTIEAEFGLLTTFSEARLLVWFEENRARLKNILSHTDFVDEISSLFERLAPLTDKEAIFKRMLEIAMADDELHVSEQALITLAKRHWGITTTSDKDAA